MHMPFVLYGEKAEDVAVEIGQNLTQRFFENTDIRIDEDAAKVVNGQTCYRVTVIFDKKAHWIKRSDRMVQYSVSYIDVLKSTAERKDFEVLSDEHIEMALGKLGLTSAAQQAS
jgi:hypothetical protein